MVNIPVSVGELVDKITILKIKSIKISDPIRLQKVERERILLDDVLNSLNVPSEVVALGDKLFDVNLTLWGVEDSLRDFERVKDFGQGFVDNARQVYHLNDLRFRLKDEINQKVDSYVQEVKSYSDY